ncbi:MAG TPA: hypothetical protein DCS07_08800 [Bdellovibrionales bacterium]|nr:MAG: hypothetical protein A2Z97_11625 [Bdellovibrionales bacterium GWB1_52_6]OFZ03916.1 MAG: hypothetical protein A2X97_16110 [Bdellovibrionales bacterium GWA1_52_35]OFZ37410.1 MAG: hypothetical protein A2070_12215 [Bdellovibrionales bacterium GWC1_52_8]HAR42708.1 hypothetical protein [Bdellovibrionales bacterium]HCM39642.1 hypothetical protein [Bdellovibrionales bacterium]
MTDLLKLQGLLFKKTHNIVPEKKVASILLDIQRRLPDEFPGKTLSDAIDSLNFELVLPNWLLSQTLIHETFFFRHPEHYEAVASHLKNVRPVKEINILCAGCSTGQEAYSLAMILDWHGLASDRVKITGLDLDPAVICTASAAQYSELELTRTPAEYRKLVSKYVAQVNGSHRGVYEVAAKIRNSVKFHTGDVFNLTPRDYNIIFVRNLLIYFSQNDQVRLLSALTSRIEQGGMLFLGSSELLPVGFQPAGWVNRASVLERKAE